MAPDREPEAPPAGGFGAAESGEGFGPIKREPTPPSMPQRVLRGVLTLLGVAGLVVVGVVVLAALWVGTRYVARQTVDMRRAESVNSLFDIAKRAQSTFDDQGTLCPSARPVPATAGGALYTSQSAEWSSDPGWSCLGFELKFPQAYRYAYQSDGTAFTATATPIDGKDAIVREVQGRVVEGRLVVDPSIREK